MQTIQFHNPKLTKKSHIQTEDITEGENRITKLAEALPDSYVTQPVAFHAHSYSLSEG